MKLNRKFLGGGVQNKNLLLGEYGYFLELHILQMKFGICLEFWFQALLRVKYLLLSKSDQNYNYRVNSVNIKIHNTIKIYDAKSSFQPPFLLQ